MSPKAEEVKSLENVLGGDSKALVLSCFLVLSHFKFFSELACLDLFSISCVPSYRFLFAQESVVSVFNLFCF